MTDLGVKNTVETWRIESTKKTKMASVLKILQKLIADGLYRLQNSQKAMKNQNAMMCAIGIIFAIFVK